MKTRNYLSYLLIAALFLLSLNSCGIGRCDATGPIEVYKTKLDYTNLITVSLSKDGKEITARPGQSFVLNQRPIPLANGYLLQRMPGNVFLSITIDEYADTSHKYSEEELLRAILDTDPYKEIYNICECLSAPDTAEINQIIRQGKLKGCQK